MTEFTNSQEARVFEIAEQKSAAAIASWQAARPRWWQIRKRLDVALAGLGVVGLLTAAGADAAWGDCVQSRHLMA